MLFKGLQYWWQSHSSGWCKGRAGETIWGVIGGANKWPMTYRRVARMMAHLYAFLQMFDVLCTFILSVKCIAHICRLVVNFLVDLHIWYDGAPQIGELMDHLQLSHANDDVGKVLLFSRCGLVEYLCLL